MEQSVGLIKMSKMLRQQFNVFNELRELLLSASFFLSPSQDFLGLNLLSQIYFSTICHLLTGWNVPVRDIAISFTPSRERTHHHISLC